MDPIPLRDIVTSIKDHFEKTGSGCPEADRVLEQSTKFDRKETPSKLQLVTFHDNAGRMIHESYVPAGIEDEKAIAFASRLLSPQNPLKEKLKNSSVKRREP